MLLEETKFTEGDKVFIFTQFPYDFSAFPVSIVDGVDLISPPLEIDLYSKDQLDKPYRFVNPSLNLHYYPQKNLCVRISSKIKNQDEIFAQILMILRLIRPLPIFVAGSFVYKNTDFCSSPTLFWFGSVLNASFVDNGRILKEANYTYDDLALAAKILKKANGFKRRSKRLKMALISFTQITLGQSLSYSMIYNELFACLETLFGSPAKAEKISNRISFFLKAICKRQRLKRWIQNRYQLGRNNISHGNPVFWTSNKQFRFSVGLKKYSELLRLHEIARLSILGFLGLQYHQLKDYNQDPPYLLSFLDNLEGAKEFLEQQKIFKNHPYKKKRSV